MVRDRSAVALIGPSATPQQASNGQLATFLYHCWFRLERLNDEHSEAVFGTLEPMLKVLQLFLTLKSIIIFFLMQDMHQAYIRLVEPVMAAIRRELGALVDKLHRVDFARIVDPVPGMGGPSFYMKDLVEKLSFIKAEVLSKFNFGDAGRSWFAPFPLFPFMVVA